MLLDSSQIQRMICCWITFATFAGKSLWKYYLAEYMRLGSERLQIVISVVSLILMHLVFHFAIKTTCWMTTKVWGKEKIWRKL